ncbi:cytochrome c [Chloroflexus sp.]|uniref:c-type cytochrome n=1 Tax=Chloroflexus sp. TaxID=1904827 RepID=UPI002ACEE2CF|nr:cytochrome c [Chloroflexus sp.]
MNRTVAWLFVLLLFALLPACGGGSDRNASNQPAEALPAALTDTSISSKGDPKRGKDLFGPCAACHTTSKEMLVGPGLAGLFSAKGPALPNGVDYNGMLPNGKERSEANVAEWIRTGGTGRIGYMPSHNLTDQEMADLMAYLRTLK